MSQVYAYILNALTSGLYNDLNYAVREYLQNAYDAIKTAKKDGIPEPEEGYCINIYISNDNRIVTIIDNGIGMDELVLSDYTSIGGGTKNDPDLTGHKGIGKLSGLRFFDKFVVKTKPYKSQVGYELVWDSGNMIRALLINPQEMKRTPYADFIEKYVQFSSFNYTGKETDHYTHIQLINVLDEYQEQLNEMKIGSFVKTSCPVPFYTEEFKTSEQINEYLGEDMVPVQTYINDKVIYQFYRDSDNLVPPLTYDIKYGDSTRAKAWISWIENTSEAIPKSEIMGIKFRCKGICVGDNNLFANNCMPPGRDLLSKWFTGEVVVLDDEIKPTAARDKFEEGPISRRFYKAVKEKIGKDLSLLADIRSDISGAEQELYKWKNNEVRSKDTSFKSIGQRIRQLQNHQKRDIYDFDFSIIDSLSNIIADAEEAIIKKNPQEESEIEDLINTGNKGELVNKMLKLKDSEPNAPSKKAKAVITKNIDNIAKALIGIKEKTDNDRELEKIYRIITKYLEANSIPYDEDNIKDFIVKEL